MFKSVLEYVEYNFGENVARQTFHRITEKVEHLKYFPGIGVKDFELAESLGFGAGVEVRHLVLQPNIVYYMIDGDDIVIIAVVYAYQSQETIKNIVTGFLEGDR